jgi:hypothetical protein
MSILKDKVDPSNGRYIKNSVKTLTANPNDKTVTKSAYTPTPAAADARNQILKDFRLGWQTMHLPRPEFNDMSLYQRHVIDMLAFNTYQENDGNPALEDRLGGWKSNAIRPIVRNKAISVAAHETARMTVPKIFAYNEESDEQEDSAKVMGYLVDWAREQAQYQFTGLYRVIASLYSPISWGYTEYAQVYRTIKDGRNADGSYNYKTVLDEDESGHKHIPVSTDQVFFGNFFERDAQKQDFLIMRRIISYDKAQEKYGKYTNFQYVQPGIQVTVSDANDGNYYNVYDPHMRGEDVEEVIYWRKSSDVRLIMVNGILLSEPDEANPRMDKQYPLDCFYYLPINERCIAGKSLVFAMQADANIANTLYQMIIDGTYLNLFPPTITTGSEKQGIDVIVPGLNLAFAEKDVTINPLRTADGQSLQTAMNTLGKVESSISESSQDPVQQGQNPGGTPSTAYEISRIETNAATVLGLSMKFIGQHAINYGKLLVGDILQYDTIANVADITGDSGLVYKTFFAPEPGGSGQMNKIKFTLDLPDTMTDEDKLEMSYQLLIKQGKIKPNTTLWMVNPSLFRNYKYKWTVDNDVLNPRSSDLIRAYDLETYNTAIASPVADQENLFRDLLMASNPKTARDPDKYISKAATAPQQPQVPGAPGAPGQQPQQPGPNQASAPAAKGTPSAAKPTSALGKLPQA